MRKLAILFCLMALCFAGHAAFADDVSREINEFHQKLVIKNRARTRATTQNGRVMYQYNIGESAEEQIGNIVADSSVKKIYNYTIVTDPIISAFKNPVEIGNVTVEGKATDVVNIVEVEGDIHSLFQPVSIGNVTLEEEGGDIENMVTIKGSIYAK